MIYTLLFLIALVASTFVKLWLDQRQVQHVLKHREQVPAAFQGRITQDAHHKAADYTVTQTRFGRWVTIYDALILLMWTLGGGLQLLSSLVNSFGLPDLLSGVVLIIAFGLISGFLHLAFNLYDTFVIEARFGFNRQTIKSFFMDMIKGTALGIAIGGPLIYLILWLMAVAGSYWWLYAWVCWFSFSLLLSWIFPIWIAPLFNKFEPLPDEALKNRIQALLTRSGFTSSGIFVMDGSRRSSHGNAYFTGMGKNKRIVFFDTLLETLNPPQIIAVLAHELGHFKYKHVIKGLALSGLFGLLGFALLAWLLPQQAFYESLGVATASTAMALILFSIVTPLLTFFLSPLMSRWSRKHEYEADSYAAQQSDPDDLITALVKMYEDNASTLTPDTLHSSFYDSHPPALLRIQHLETLKQT